MNSGLLVAALSGDHTTNPIAPVWLSVGHTVRVRLAHLPGATDAHPRAA